VNLIGIFIVVVGFLWLQAKVWVKLGHHPEYRDVFALWRLLRWCKLVLTVWLVVAGVGYLLQISLVLSLLTYIFLGGSLGK